MASSSKIKGITIEIGGNTTKLENALKDVNKVVYSTNTELKELNKALKLDPKNTELLAQKQEVLKNNIEATTKRLNTLKTAQQQMGSYAKLTDEQKEKYRALSIEIAKSESALRGMKEELKATSSINLSGLVTGLKNVGVVASQVLTTVTKVASTVGAALGAIVTAGVKSYAELEQNLGGVETLFGDAADIVKKNAAEAYKTAGVSANEYMQGVTSFSASLLQSLSGDTQKAAEVADMAFRDMSDNANKFGTDMSSIQSAYQGFAKQNYTMLDNLKLGYGGTKTEMQRLLKDAQKFSGIKYDINNLNDVYEAIHVIQQEMGVTGTTAKEANSTISGSVKSMKSAFNNFLNGSGSPKALAEATLTAFKNIANVVKDLAPQILEGIVDLINEVLPSLVDILNQNLPMLIDSALNIMQKLLDSISTNTKPIVTMIKNVFSSIVKFITTNLPTIFKAGLEILLELIKGISDNLDEIIPAVVDCILTITTTLLENMDKIIEAGFNLVLELAKGLVQAIPKLVEKIPDIIQALIDGFGELAVKIFELGEQILDWLIDGIVNIGVKMTTAVKKIWESIKENVKKFFGKAGDYIAGAMMGKDVDYNISESVTNGLTAGTSAAEKINSSSSGAITINIDNFNNTSGGSIQGLAQELEFYRKGTALARGGK